MNETQLFDPIHLQTKMAPVNRSKLWDYALRNKKAFKVLHISIAVTKLKCAINSYWNNNL